MHFAILHRFRLQMGRILLLTLIIVTICAITTPELTFASGTHQPHDSLPLHLHRSSSPSLFFLSTAASSSLWGATILLVSSLIPSLSPLLHFTSVEAHRVDTAQRTLYSQAWLYWNFSSPINSASCDPTCSVCSCDPGWNVGPSGLSGYIDLNGFSNSPFDLTKDVYYYPGMNHMQFPIYTLAGSDGGWSFSAWLMHSGYFGFEPYAPIFSLTSMPDKTAGITLSIHQATRKLVYRDDVGTLCWSNWPVSLQLWTIVGMTLSGTGNTYLYINGELAGSCSPSNLGEPSTMQYTARNSMFLSYDPVLDGHGRAVFSAVAYWNQTLSQQDHAVLARTIPESLGKFQFAFSPTPSSPYLGLDTTFTYKLSLPLSFVPAGSLPLSNATGGNVTLLLETSPPGGVSPTRISWNPLFPGVPPTVNVAFSNPTGAAFIHFGFALLSQPQGFQQLFFPPQNLTFRNLTGVSSLLVDEIWNCEFSQPTVDGAWSQLGNSNASNPTANNTLGMSYIAGYYWVYFNSQRSINLLNRNNYLGNEVRDPTSGALRNFPFNWHPTLQGFSLSMWFNISALAYASTPGGLITVNRQIDQPQGLELFGITVRPFSGGPVSPTSSVVYPPGFLFGLIGLSCHVLDVAYPINLPWNGLSLMQWVNLIFTNDEDGNVDIYINGRLAFTNTNCDTPAPIVSGVYTEAVLGSSQLNVQPASDTLGATFAQVQLLQHKLTAKEVGMLANYPPTNLKFQSHPIFMVTTPSMSMVPNQTFTTLLYPVIYYGGSVTITPHTDFAKFSGSNPIFTWDPSQATAGAYPLLPLMFNFSMCANCSQINIWWTISGDTMNHAPPPNITIYRADFGFLQSRMTVSLNCSHPSVHGGWYNATDVGLYGNLNITTGMCSLQPQNDETIDLLNVNDLGTNVTMPLYLPSYATSYGFSMIFTIRLYNAAAPQYVFRASSWPGNFDINFQRNFIGNLEFTGVSPANNGFYACESNMVPFPVRQFVTIGFSYDKNSTIAVYMQGANFQYDIATCALPLQFGYRPDVRIGPNGMTITGVNGELNRMWYFPHTLSPDEFQIVASTPPPEFKYMRLPIFTDIPPPYSLPFDTNGWYRVIFGLPHFYGNNVTLFIDTNPPNLFTANRIDWSPTVPGYNDNVQLNMSLAVLKTLGVHSFTVSFRLSGDTTNYSVPEYGNYTVLEYDSTQMFNTMIFGLNISVTPGGPQPPTQQARWYEFDGLYSYLNLSVGNPIDVGTNLITPARGSGVQDPIPADLYWNPFSEGRATGNGWTVEGWFQLLHHTKKHTILSCSADGVYNTESFTLFIANQEYGFGFAQSVETMANARGGCSCSSALPTFLPLYGWHHYGFSFDSLNQMRFVIDGQLLATCACFFMRSIPRPYCTSGKRSFTFDGDFMYGNMAAMRVYNRSLHELELASLASVLTPQVSKFAIVPNTPPPQGLLASPPTPYTLTIYTPFSFGNVTLSVFASVASALVSNPVVLNWAAGDIQPKTVDITMPVGYKQINLTFTTCCDPRFLPLDPVIIKNFTGLDLFAAAAINVNMSRPSQNAGWVRSLNNKPYNGLATFSQSSQYLNLNNTNDTLGAPYLDAYMVMKQRGFTIHMWLSLPSVDIPYPIFEAYQLGTNVFQYFSVYTGQHLTATNPGAAPTATNCIYYCYRGYESNSGWADDACQTFPQCVWQPLQWFALTLVYDGFYMTFEAFINGKSIGVFNNGMAQNEGKWVNWRIGKPIYGPPPLASYNLADAQVAQVTVWPRNLLPWEVAVIGLVTPPNISPVQFLLLPAPSLAVGWGMSTQVSIASYINFGSDPVLTAQVMVGNGLAGGLISYQGVPVYNGQQFHMSNYFYSYSAQLNTGYLVLDITAPPFTNQPNSGMVPSVSVNWTLSGDTERFIAPALSATNYGIPSLLAFANFSVNPDVPSLHAGYLKGPSNITGTGVYSFNGFQYLDMFDRHDVNQIAPRSLVFPSTTPRKGGELSMDFWLKLASPQPKPTGSLVTTTIFWAGTYQKATLNDIILEVILPSNLVRLRWYNASSFGRPLDGNCISNRPLPLERYVHLALNWQVTGNVTNYYIYQSGNLVSNCTYKPKMGAPFSGYRDSVYLGYSSNFITYNFLGQIAAFRMWPRALTYPEITALAASPPYGINPIMMNMTSNFVLSRTSLSQYAYVTITPGLETILGLDIRPSLKVPVWYMPTTNPLITTYMYKNTSTRESIPYLSYPVFNPDAWNTQYFNMSWPATLPLVQVFLNMTDDSHYNYNRNLTVVNPLPGQILNEVTFALNANLPSLSAGWQFGLSWVPGTGFAVFNGTMGRLDLNLTTDTRQSNISRAILPSILSSSGFTYHAWLRFDALPASPPSTNPWFFYTQAVANSDDAIFLRFDYATATITFGYNYGNSATPSCTLTSSAPVNFTVWTPVVARLASDGTMILTIGVMRAQFNETRTICSQYPNAIISRQNSKLGGNAAAGPSMQAAAFYYWPRSLTDLESQILLYAPPASISPANFILGPYIPSHLFLGETFDFTFYPNSYSTLSGVANIEPRATAGSFVPQYVTFNDSRPVTFTFVAPQFTNLVNISFKLTSVQFGFDDYYFNSPPGFSIPVDIGFWKVINMPKSMLPHQTITIGYTPQSNPTRSVTLNFLTTSGATVTPSSLMWVNGTVITTQYITIETTGAATWFNLSYVVSGQDYLVWNAPPWQNITVAPTSSFAFTDMPTFVYSTELTPPVTVYTAAPPKQGVSLNMTSTLGRSSLSVYPSGASGYPWFWTFSPGMTMTYQFQMQIPTRLSVDWFVLSFNSSGNDTMIFGRPDPLNITILPQRNLNWVPALPSFVYENQVLVIGLLPEDAPNSIIYVDIFPGNATVPDGSFSYLSIDTNSYWSNFGVPSTFTLNIDPLDPSVDSGFAGASFFLSGPDRFHYFQLAPVQFNVIKPTPLMMITPIPDNLAASQAFTMQIVITHAPPHAANAQLQITVSDGSVFPPVLNIDSATWNTSVLTFSFLAPSIGQYVTFDFAMTGTDQYAFIPPVSFDVAVKNSWIITNIPDYLNINQRSGAIKLEPIGFSPAVTILFGASVPGGLFTPPLSITMSPTDPYVIFYYHAPPIGHQNVTLNFTLYGGTDRFLFFDPPSFTIPIIQIDFSSLTLDVFAWNPDLIPYLPMESFFIEPPSYGMNATAQRIVFPYRWGSISVTPIFNSAGSVFLSAELANVSTTTYLASPQVPVTNVTAFTLPLHVGEEFILLLNSTRDEQFYTVNVVRAEPDVLSLDITAIDSNPVRNHKRRFLDMTPPAYNLAQTQNWYANVTNYTYTMPWITDTVVFNAKFTEYVNLVTLSYDSTTVEMDSDSDVIIVFPEGLTTVIFNSTLDGVYILNFYRMPINLVNFTVTPIPIQPMIRSASATFRTENPASGSYLYPGLSFNDSFPFYVSQVSFQYSVHVGDSTNDARVVPLATYQSNYFSVLNCTAALLCNVSVPLPLAVGSNLFVLIVMADNYEPYFLNITRAGPDMTALSQYGMEGGEWFGGVRTLTNSPYMSPSFVAGVFDYGSVSKPINISNSIRSIAFTPMYSSNYTTNISFPAYGTQGFYYPSGQTTEYFNISVGLNVFSWVTLDGVYTYTYWRDEPSVISVSLVQMHQNTTNVTLGYSPSFVPSMLDGYTGDTVLFIYRCVWVTVNFDASWGATTSVSMDGVGSTVVQPNQQSTTCLPVLQGANKLYITNSEDGVYTIFLWRQFNDIKWLTLFPNSGRGPGPTNQLMLSPSQFDTSISSFSTVVDYITFNVELTLNFSTPNTIKHLMNGVDLGSLTTLTSTNAGLTLNVGVNTLLIDSKLDGVYTFFITRNPPDLHDIGFIPSFPLNAGVVSLSPGTVFDSAVRNYTATVYSGAWKLFFINATIGTESTIMIDFNWGTPFQPNASTNMLDPFNLIIGVNRIRITSLHDGEYQFLITRLPLDVQDVSLIAHSHSVEFAAPSTSPFTPHFLKGNYDYSLTVPYIVDSVFVQATFSTISTVDLWFQNAWTSLTSTISTSSNFPLVVNQTAHFLLQSTRDGNFTIAVFRKFPDVLSISWTGYDEINAQQSVPLASAFVPGSYYYTVSFPYKLRSVLPSVTTVLNTTSQLSIDGHGLPVPFSSSSLFGPNILFVNDTEDGSYIFTFLRNEPDIDGVCITSNELNSRTLMTSTTTHCGALPLYAAPTSGATANASALTWSATTEAYYLAVPYIIPSINLFVNFSTASTSSITKDGFGIGTPHPTNVNTWIFNLNVGLNIFRVNSTLDGYYSIYITRAQQDISDLRLIAVTNSPGYSPSSTVTAPLTPIYALSTFSYLVTVPYIVGSVNLNASFATVGSTSIYVDNTAQTEFINSASASHPIPLPAGASTTVYVMSAQDGNFTIVITRLVADVTGFALTTYDQYGATTTLSLTPTFTNGLYNYPLNFPYGAVKVSAAATFGVAGSITYESAMKTLSTGSIDSFRINSTRDGQYWFTLNRMQPDINGTIFQLTDGEIVLDASNVIAPFVPAQLYIGASSGATSGQMNANWSSSIRSYAVTVPFIRSSVQVKVACNTPSTASITMSSTVQLWTTCGLDFNFNLIVGANVFKLNSTLDGYYVIVITRAQQDVSNIRLIANTNSLGYSPSTVTAPLTPIYALGTFAYSVTVPYIVGSVNVNATFATTGATAFFVDNTAQTDYLQTKQASAVISLPIGASTTVYVMSAQDGNYTIVITRLIADVTNFNITTYDQYGRTTLLALTPTFANGLYNYSLDFPYGAVKVSAAAAFSIAGSITYESALKTLSTGSVDSFRINSTRDGQYWFTLNRMPPDIDSMCLESSDTRLLIASASCSYRASSGPYNGFSIGYTAGQAALNFSSSIRSYTLKLPFVMSSVQLFVNMSTDHSVVVRIDSSIPTVLSNNGLGISNWNLNVGLNILRINSTLDGYYVAYLYRASPDVISLTASANYTMVGFKASMALSPVFTKGGSMQYSLTVPYVVQAVSFNVTFNTASSLTLYYPDGSSTYVVSKSWNVISLQPGSSVPLVLASWLDGNYTLTLTRRMPDVTGWTVIAYDQFNFPTTLALNPTYADGQMTYALQMPFKAVTVQVTPTLIPSSNATINATNKGLPLTLSHVNLNSNTIVVNVSTDGTYRFAFTFAPPDINGISTQTVSGSTLLLNSVANALMPTPATVAYQAPHFGLTANFVMLNFTNLQWVYRTTTPYVWSSVVLAVDTHTAGTLSIGDGVTSNPITLTSDVSTWPLIVGVNRFWVNSTLDGYYILEINRTTVDVIAIKSSTGMLVDGNIPGAAPAPLVTFIPPFTPLVFTYNAVVGFRVGAVNITLQSAAGLHAYASVVLPPNSNVTTVITEVLDGDYTFNIRRAPPDITGITIKPYGQLAYSFPPIPIANFTPGVLSYWITVPWGVFSVSATAVGTAGTYAIEPRVAMGFTGGVIHVNSTLDGIYSVFINRLPPDVLNFQFSARNASSGTLMPMPIVPMFAVGLMDYTSFIDFGSDGFKVRIYYNTPNTIKIYSVLTGWIGAPAAGDLSDAVPLNVGVNTVIFNSASDGNYTFTITRDRPPPLCTLSPCQNGGTCIDTANGYDYNCTCRFGYSGKSCEDTIVPTKPPTITAPVAILVAPSVISTCDMLTLDGRSSFSNEPVTSYSTLLFRWSVSKIVVNSVDLIATGAVPSATVNPGVTLGTFMNSDQSMVRIDASTLLFGAQYTFSLRVEDNSGSSPFASSAVALGNLTCIPWMVSLAIRPPRIVLRPIANQFDVDLLPGVAPLPADAQLFFQWSVFQVSSDNVDVPVVSSISVPTTTRSLVLPPYYLTVNQLYRVYLRLQVSSASAYGGVTRRLLAISTGVVTGTANCQVMIQVSPSQLIPMIAGGDRSRRIDQLIVVDASQSYDPDVQTPQNPTVGYPFTFAWRCDVMSPAGAPCTLPSAQVNQPILQLPANYLLQDYTYRFTVMLTAPNRTASANVRVDITPVPLIPAPIVLISNVPYSINAEQVLRLTSTVVSTTSTPPYLMTYNWTSVPSYDYSSPSVISTTPGAANLVLWPNVLQPGFVSFKLTVCDPVNGACSTASAVVPVNYPPMGGTCTIDPTSGMALDTNFWIHCAGWFAPSGQVPLKYTFQYQKLNGTDHSVKQLSSGSSQNPDLTTLLPAGYLNIIVLISDQLNATTKVILPIMVDADPRATTDPACYAQNITNLIAASVAAQNNAQAFLLISELALMNTSSISGVSVGCSGASSADLLSSLATIVNTTTPSSATSALIAQTLSSITSNPDALSSNSSWALAQQLLNVAIAGLNDNDPSVNKTDLVASLANSASDLITDCSKLDAAGTTIGQLLSASASGSSAGEQSTTLSTDNFQATVTRTDLAAGASYQDGDASVTLPPSALSGYVSSLSTVNKNNIDQAGSSTPLTLDTRVVQYNTSLAPCRQTVLDDGTIQSNLTSIELTLSDGSDIDFSQLTGPINFLIPVNSSSLKQPKVCPGEIAPNATSLLHCSWYDPVNKTYTMSGCVTNGMTNNGQSMNCSCQHLTEFAILYKESQALLGDCPVPVNLGQTDYLVFLILYSIVALIAFIQLCRIVYHGGFRKYWLMSIEHTLIIAICFFRALNQLIYYHLYHNFSLTQQILVSSMPYLFLSWIYSFVIVAWASIYHASTAMRRDENPFAAYQSRFILANTIVSLVLIGIFAKMAFSDLDTMQRLYNLATVIIFVMSCCFVLFFAVYGSLMYRALTKDGFASPYARKLASVAVGLSASFAASCGVLLFSVTDSTKFEADALAYNDLYFTFDIIGLLIVLLLFAKSVHDMIHPPAKSTAAAQMSKVSRMPSSVATAKSLHPPVESSRVAPIIPVLAATNAADSSSDSESDHEHDSDSDSDRSVDGSDSDNDESVASPIPGSVGARYSVVSAEQVAKVREMMLDPLPPAADGTFTDIASPSNTAAANEVDGTTKRQAKFKRGASRVTRQGIGARLAPLDNAPAPPNISSPTIAQLDPLSPAANALESSPGATKISPLLNPLPIAAIAAASALNSSSPRSMSSLSSVVSISSARSLSSRFATPRSSRKAIMHVAMEPAMQEKPPSPVSNNFVSPKEETFSVQPAPEIAVAPINSIVPTPSVLLDGSAASLAAIESMLAAEAEAKAKAAQLQAEKEAAALAAIQAEQEAAALAAAIAASTPIVEIATPVEEAPVNETPVVEVAPSNSTVSQAANRRRVMTNLLQSAALQMESEESNAEIEAPFISLPGSTAPIEVEDAIAVPAALTVDTGSPQSPSVEPIVALTPSSIAPMMIPSPTMRPTSGTPLRPGFFRASSTSAALTATELRKQAMAAGMARIAEQKKAAAAAQVAAFKKQKEMASKESESESGSESESEVKSKNTNESDSGSGSGGESDSEASESDEEQEHVRSKQAPAKSESVSNTPPVPSVNTSHASTLPTSAAGSPSPSIVRSTAETASMSPRSDHNNGATPPSPKSLSSAGGVPTSSPSPSFRHQRHTSVSSIAGRVLVGATHSPRTRGMQPPTPISLTPLASLLTPISMSLDSTPRTAVTDPPTASEPAADNAESGSGSDSDDSVDALRAPAPKPIFSSIRATSTPSAAADRSFLSDSGASPSSKALTMKLNRAFSQLPAASAAASSAKLEHVSDVVNAATKKPAAPKMTRLQELAQEALEKAKLRRTAKKPVFGFGSSVIKPTAAGYNTVITPANKK